MLAPRRAMLREGLLPTLEEDGELNGTTVGEGETAGGSATTCCLDHIKPPSWGMKSVFAPGGREQVKSMLRRESRRSNKERRWICAVRKLTEWTGGRQQDLSLRGEHYAMPSSALRKPTMYRREFTARPTARVSLQRPAFSPANHAV